MGIKNLDLVFDVETTGLPPPNMSKFDGESESEGISGGTKKRKSREYEELARPFRSAEKYPVAYKNVADDLDRLPYITQISWALIDAKKHNII
jgi:hypothetical protein